MNVPDEDTKNLIEQGIVSGHSNNIPEEAWHLVLLNTYICLIPEQPFSYNVVEVTVLGHGGLMLSDYEKVFFPAYRVGSWMKKNCAVVRRKKHILSTLRSRTDSQHNLIL